MAVNVINTQALTKKFGDLTAVNNVTLDIQSGELFGLLGPNGAGKTTFLKILTGQLEPNSGIAKVLGVDPAKDPISVKGKIGIVPEIESPPSFLTPKEYFQYVCLVRDLEDAEQRASHWLDFMDLREYQDVPGKDLSKGTRQRVMLGAAFIHKPKLVFLDEPFIGLDPYHQKMVKEFLGKYLKDGGTIFMCTHILEIAEKMCSKITIINKGKIVSSGTLAQLTKDGEALDSAFLRLTGRSSED